MYATLGSNQASREQQWTATARLPRPVPPGLLVSSGHVFDWVTWSVTKFLPPPCKQPAGRRLEWAVLLRRHGPPLPLPCSWLEYFLVVLISFPCCCSCSCQSQQAPCGHSWPFRVGKTQSGTAGVVTPACRAASAVVLRSSMAGEPASMLWHSNVCVTLCV
jgi:hypothetical protein